MYSTSWQIKYEEKRLNQERLSVASVTRRMDNGDIYRNKEALQQVYVFHLLRGCIKEGVR